MSGRVWVRHRSNNRVAWLMAGAAVAAIVSLPLPASAQSEFSRPGQPGGPPSAGPAAFGAKSANTPAKGPKTDIMDLRDRAEAAPMAKIMPATVDLTAEASAVICIAGCDQDNGKPVYQGGAKTAPTLSAIELNPKPLNSHGAVQTVAHTDSGAAGGVLACIAGCYDEKPKPSLTNYGSAVARAPTPAKATREARATESPAKTLADAGPAVVEQRKQVKLRTAFQPHSRSQAAKVRKVAKKPTRNRYAAPRQHTVAAKPVVEPAKITAVATKPEDQPAAAVSVTPKPAARKTARVPLSTVSNDWFNKIKNKQKSDDAAPASTN